MDSLLSLLINSHLTFLALHGAQIREHYTHIPEKIKLQTISIGDKHYHGYSFNYVEIIIEWNEMIGGIRVHTENEFITFTPPNHISGQLSKLFLLDIAEEKKSDMVYSLLRFNETYHVAQYDRYKI